MCRHLSCLVSLVLAMTLVSSASAVTQWTNAGGDNLWQNPLNWSAGVPGPGTGNAQINPSFITGPMVGPLIGAGVNAVTDAADTWGPEFGAISLDIMGGSYVSPAFVGMVTVGTAEDARPQVNLGAGGSGGILDVINFLVGDSWWWSGGPYTTYNQYSGSAIVRDSLWLGGKANLYGGTMDVANGVSMASVGQDPALCTLNIAGGKLVLPASYTANVQSWIAAGYCKAYGGAGQIVIEETGGRTIVTAIPEPSTMALLCVGGLALIRRRRS